MRTVQIFKRVFVPSEEQFKAGTWQNKPDKIGYFHSWGTDYEEFESGAGNFSVAIVELSDGTIIMPRADMVKFIEK